ncbi:MAG TPA: alpha/beta hydrolase [Stellaceae bacterium]|jgi:pimeloyl-ACP methyl ester carboxylesterase|nr:alpha/beta hydrolase [Stellaceae bacterium]
MDTLMTAVAEAPKLDPREQHFRIPSSQEGLTLFLRYLPPALDTQPDGRTVLYVHGGTFSSALSIAHRFDGRSWRDALCDAGFHVWGLDFHGFGYSDPYPEMAQPAEANPPLGRTAACSRQLEAAVRFICRKRGVARVSLAVHSWGSIVAGEFAGRCPDLVDRLVFFGPIARRDPHGERQRLPGWRPISLQDQWDRFVADVPAGAALVLSRRHFDEWGARYLDTDPRSRTRQPAAVQVPGGAFQDIYDAWAGELAYYPALVRAPVAIIRGEWDSLCTDADARWLFDALSNAPIRRDIKIARATHLMHLEENRFALYREAECFLKGGDAAG